MVCVAFRRMRSGTKSRSGEEEHVASASTKVRMLLEARRKGPFTLVQSGDGRSRKPCPDTPRFRINWPEKFAAAWAFRKSASSNRPARSGPLKSAAAQPQTKKAQLRLF